MSLCFSISRPEVRSFKLSHKISNKWFPIQKLIWRNFQRKWLKLSQKDMKGELRILFSSTYKTAWLMNNKNSRIDWKKWKINLKHWINFLNWCLRIWKSTSCLVFTTIFWDTQDYSVCFVRIKSFLALICFQNKIFQLRILKFKGVTIKITALDISCKWRDSLFWLTIWVWVPNLF